MTSSPSLPASDWSSKILSRLVRAGRLAFRRPGEAIYCLGVLCLAAAVPALVRLPLPVLAAGLTAVTRSSRARAAPPDEAERLAGLVLAVLSWGRPLVRPGCLTRGLTLFACLRRAGVPVTLRFGAGTIDGVFAGHCWLTIDGQPYLEATDPRGVFVETYRLPAAGRMPAPAPASGA